MDHYNDQIMTRIRQNAISIGLGVCLFGLSAGAFSTTDDVRSKNIDACKCLDEQDCRLRMRELAVKNNTLTTEINTNGIKIAEDQQLLKAFTHSTEPDDFVSVQQLDYGKINGIFLDRGLGIIAIGNQTSFRVRVRTVAGKAQFYDRQELPTLYRGRCGLLGLLFGSCQIARTHFSRELGVAFASGYNYLGLKRSYVFGLDSATPVKEMRIPKKDLAYYFFDMPGSGGAAFREYGGQPPGNFYFFDGKNFFDCKKAGSGP